MSATPWAQLKPNKVTPATLRTFILQTRKKVKPGTVKLVVALLSSLYSDLIESEHAVIKTSLVSLGVLLGRLCPDAEVIQTG